MASEVRCIGLHQPNAGIPRWVHQRASWEPSDAHKRDLRVICRSEITLRVIDFLESGERPALSLRNPKMCTVRNQTTCFWSFCVFMLKTHRNPQRKHCAGKVVAFGDILAVHNQMHTGPIQVQKWPKPIARKLQKP